MPRGRRLEDPARALTVPAVETHPLPPAVAAALDAYVPELASQEHAPLIRGLAAAVRQQTKADVLHTASLLSGFVYWLEQTGRTVDQDALLDIDLVELYAAVGLAELSASTRAHMRTGLRRVIRAHHGPLFGDYRARPAKDRAQPLVPYTPDQVDGLLSWAGARTTPVRRHAMLAVAALGLGAGLDAGEVCDTRGADVARDPDGTVLVTVRGDRPRRVPVVRRYEDLLLRLAADTAKEWIVNPRVDPGGRTGNVLGAQFPPKDQGPTTGPHLTVVRARVTWIVRHLDNAVPINAVADAAGLDHVALARYMVHLAPVGAAARNALLRGQ